MFDPSSLISRLEAFPDALRAACSIVSDADARWAPAAGGWSIAQIALHMLLEERQDFRPRVLSTLRDPDAPWTPIDPERAVREAWGSEGARLSSILDDFARERADSVVHLRAVEATAEWTRTYVARNGPPLSAGQLLACWAAHDALHLRQIGKRLHELAVRDAGGADLGYAG
ncbi:MAG: DinB family protein, partial [Phycisphaerales bacterium]